MPDCPKCQTALVRRKNDFGVFWFCERCEGSAVTMSLLRKVVERDALNGLWQRARMGSYPKKHPCPGCNHRMEEISIEAGGRTRAIDVCTSCQFVWLDVGEWQDLAFFKVDPSSAEANQSNAIRERIEQMRRARSAPPPVPRREVAPTPAVAVRSEPRGAARQDSGAARREALRRELEQRKLESERRSARSESRPERRVFQPRPKVREARRESGWGEGPAAAWHWIPALLGMPVEEEPPVGRLGQREKPWLTWTLAFGVGLVSVLAMFDLSNVIAAYGLIPAEAGRLGGLTWLTSFFLHGGLLHLIGNLYFLVIFGDNVEKCLGTLEFFLLICVAALCGDFVHILLDPDSTVPCIGASGGISGVIAFYALRFPQTRLTMLFWFFFKTYWWRMPAIWMFGLWVVFQFVIAGQQIAGISKVSGGAHLGGALVGVVAWLLWRVNGGLRDAQARVAGGYLRE